ncbi:glycosyltransferase [Thalassospira sp.]|uniref:glycosyltransferase n=1 Tax=Thalassospira sp. TaxID=1912094 RepID=UPI000C5EA493|nr:glycosyltransferase [Thalassospira sp.]MBC07689.1 hypothetical protein [Thalassospira sp.]|tara:strand:+ start:1996 stop:3279 length:1284 start_codon:yes stop_codon:yes gene_type:complete
MNILIAGGAWPYTVNSKEAANVISHQICSHLLDAPDLDVRYVVINSTDVDLPVEAMPDLEDLKRRGMRVLNPIKLERRNGLVNKLKKLFYISVGRAEHLLDGFGQEHLLDSSLQGWKPDAVLVVWAETAANFVCRFPAVRFNYAGNPENKVFAARSELQAVLGVGLLSRLKSNLIERVIRAGHHNVMRRYHHLWNVAANDAANYQTAGINAHYLQNMWPSSNMTNWETTRDNYEKLEPVKIAGSVGNIGATGNSFGLITLCDDVIPALRKQLGAGNFEVHLFGGGTPHAAVEPKLNEPEIKVRGFVDEIDKELLEAPIFLITNNSRRFKVGHTRFLHAWSLGACVVAFRDSCEAMPEIRNDYNALLGDSAEEIAALIARAKSDKSLRRRIGSGGVETLKTYFSPQKVCGEIQKQMQAKMQSKDKTTS